MKIETIKIIAGFVTGFGIGALVTNKLVSEKKQAAFDAQYQSVLDYYASKPEEYPEDVVLAEEEPELPAGLKQPDLLSLKPLVTNVEPIDYTTYAKPAPKKKKAPAKTKIEIDEEIIDHFSVSEIIKLDPDNVEVPDGFREECLILYADHTLADQFGDVVEDIEYHVGIINMDHLSHSLDGVVYVQNNTLKTVFEITSDPANYGDLYTNKGRRK